MPSPFPGMDPYLEDSALWSGFHHSFLSAMQERLAPLLRPKYFVRVEERVYVTGEDDPGYRHIVPDVRVVESARRNRPAITAGAAPNELAIVEPVPVIELTDPEVHEYRLEVLDRVDRAVVTVIELLSPTNKTPHALGRESLLQKRKEVIAWPTHWTEIDLLLDGVRTTNPPGVPGSEYLVYLSRHTPGGRRAYAWPIKLRHALPVIGIPLRGDEPDAPLDLQAAFTAAYDVGAYDLDLDYQRPCKSPLAADDAQWAQQLVAAGGQ
jgi:hypothetical protein